SVVADGQTSTLVSSGAVLELDGSGGDLNMPAEYVGLAGSGIGGKGALRNVAGNNTPAAGLASFSHCPRQSAPNTSLTVNGQVQDYVPLTKPIAVPAAALTKTGTGTLVFTAANSYSGKTNVNAGVLNIRNDYALGYGLADPSTNQREQQQITV